MQLAHLFEGLTVRRVIAVTVICFAAAFCIRPFFINPLIEQLLIATCIGYTSMLLFTIATNLEIGVPREVRQVLSVFVGSFLLEIFFSILQRKVLTPNDLTDLDALTARVLAFQDRYNATATPFDWRFTRTDLDRLLERIAAHEPAPAPATTTAA